MAPTAKIHQTDALHSCWKIFPQISVFKQNMHCMHLPHTFNKGHFTSLIV